MARHFACSRICLSCGRAVDALNDNAYVFHGFVYNEGLVPQRGLVVRLIDAGQTSKGQVLEAITSSEGYFRIKLGVKGGTSGGPQPINDLFMGSTGTKRPKSDTPTTEAQVEILRKEKVIYSDSDPVPLDQGTAYREYVISSDEPPATTPIIHSEEHRTPPKSARSKRSP